MLNWDAFLVSGGQGPVDSPANFVQGLTAIRWERGEILSHGGCWHGKVYHEGFCRGNPNVLIRGPGSSRDKSRQDIRCAGVAALVPSNEPAVALLILGTDPF